MRERLTIFVIVGMRTDEHSLRSQVGIGSESDCLLGQLERILEISDSVVIVIINLHSTQSRVSNELCTLETHIHTVLGKLTNTNYNLINL